MALTVTVTPVPAMWGYRLTATGYSGVVSWYRAAGATDLHLGDGPTVLDRGVRLNEPVTYFATDDVDLVVAASPVEMAADLPVLAQTMNSAAKPVHVDSYRPYSGEGRSVWHPVIGRSDPFVSIFPATYPQGELVLRAADNAERTELIRMMQPGDPLLIRSTCPDRLDTMTFLMLGWNDPYARDEAQGGPSLIRIRYQRVTEVLAAWTPSPDWTYQAVLDTHPTYQAVLDAFPTYQALLDGVPG